MAFILGDTFKVSDTRGRIGMVYDSETMQRHIFESWIKAHFRFGLPTGCRKYDVAEILKVPPKMNAI